MSFDKGIQSCNYHDDQDIAHFYHLPKFLCVSFKSIPFPLPQPKGFTCLFSDYCIFYLLEFYIKESYSM